MGGSTKVTLFSIEEANRMVAELRPNLERLSAMKRDFDQLGTRAEALGLAVSGAAADNPDAVELQQITSRRDALAEQILEGVEAVQRRGCLLKDIARGLIDFYALSGDRLIFLCWQLGEREVAHWHTLEGGFAGRQPLDRLERG